MKKSETAENKVHVPRFPQILATPLVENLGFAATPREFLKKIPGKTTLHTVEGGNHSLDTSTRLKIRDETRTGICLRILHWIQEVEN